MGVKVGRFGSKNGHAYEVRLSGNSVESGEILLGVPPVTISMAAGEHKFCGFKFIPSICTFFAEDSSDFLDCFGVDNFLAAILTVENRNRHTPFSLT